MVFYYLRIIDLSDNYASANIPALVAISEISLSLPCFPMIFPLP